MDKIIVLISGIVGIIITYWFFFMKKIKTVEVEGEIDIIVKGGYKPESITVPAGRKTNLNFIRKDPSSCLEEVVIPEFKVRKFLPLNEKTSIIIIPDKKGSFDFECGMGMYHGKLIIT